MKILKSVSRLKIPYRMYRRTYQFTVIWPAGLFKISKFGWRIRSHYSLYESGSSVFKKFWIPVLDREATPHFATR
jgi:hypothetical protein